MKKYMIFSGMALAIVFITLSSFGIFHGKKEMKNDNSSVAVKQEVSVKEKILVANTNLTRRGDALVRNRLYLHVENVYDLKIDANSFARCPSGLQYNLIASPTKASPYFVGWIKNYNGCKGKKIVKFRINEDETKLEVFDTNSKSFLSIADWVKASEKGQTVPQSAKESAAEG